VLDAKAIASLGVDCAAETLLLFEESDFNVRGGLLEAVRQGQPGQAAANDDDCGHGCSV
jgi:hypothetical protein